MCKDSLRRQADAFIDIVDIKQHVMRASPRRGLAVMGD
jgi:hypothetical protein